MTPASRPAQPVDWAALEASLRESVVCVQASLRLSHDEAEETLQTALIELYQRPPEGAPRPLHAASAAGYRHAFLRHRALRVLRRRAAAWARLREAAPELERRRAAVRPAAGESLCAIYRRLEDLHAERLPPELRRVLILVARGWRGPCLSRALALPQPVVRALLLRATAALLHLDEPRPESALALRSQDWLAALPSAPARALRPALASAGWQPAEIAHVRRQKPGTIRRYLERNPPEA